MFDVIFRRETKSMVRHRWIACLLLAPLVLFSLVVVVRWPSEAEVDLAGHRAVEVFGLFAYALFGAVLLLSPAYPAASLVTEKRQGTLALLLNTPLSGLSIYLGKLATALFFSGLPLAMSLPVAGACYALGAIDLVNQLALLYGVLLIVTVQYSALALAISSQTRTAIAAMRITYLVVLALVFLPLWPYWFALRGGGEVSSSVLWSRSLTPLPAIMEVIGHGDFLGGGVAVHTGEPLRFAITALLISVVAAVFTVRQLKQTMFDRARPSGTMTDDRSRSTRWLRRGFFLLDPQRRTRAIASWVNPVFVKEFRARRFGRGPWVVRMVCGCAVISLALTYVTTTGTIAWRTETIGGIMVLLQVAILLIVTPSLASGLISDEQENGGWSLLRMTPLTPGQIVTGKLLSVAWTMLLLLLATLPGYAVMMLIRPVMTQQVLAVLLTLILTGGFTISLGAAFSSFFRRTSTATVMTYTVLLTLFGGTLAMWLARGAPFGPQLVEGVLVINPIAAALSLIETPGFETYHLVPACWYLIGIATVVCVAVLYWRTRVLTLPVAVAVGCLLCGGPDFTLAIEPRSLIEEDPYFEPLDVVNAVPAGTLPLWLETLRQGETAGRREACIALSRAHRLGMPVRDVAADALTDLISKPELSPSVQRSAAQTIVDLEIRTACGPLQRVLAATDDRELRRIAEPALARWEFAPMVDRWQALLRDPTAPIHRRATAIQALGHLRHAGSQDDLSALAADRQANGRLRMAAAAAIRQLTDVDHLTDVEHLTDVDSLRLAAELGRGDRTDRGVAATLLSTARGEEARTLLAGLAADGDTAVAAIALGRLLEIAPKQCLPIADHWIDRGHPPLRMLVIACYRANPTPQSASQLALMLDDPHPAVRGAAADALADLSPLEPLRETIQYSIEEILSGRAANPKAVEQAALIAGTIDHRAVAPLLVERLAEPRVAVTVAAAWALAELALPSSAAAVVDEVRQDTDRTLAIIAELRPAYAENPDSPPDLPDLDGLYREHAQLLLALGRMKHRAAVEMLARYVPKPPPQYRGQAPPLETFTQPATRAAAIWSLGKIYEGGDEPPANELVAQLVSRMTDTTPIPAEDKLVRKMAAVSLARMGQSQLLPTFREFFDPNAEHNEVGRACGWAIERFTGRAPDRNTTRRIVHLNWFLVPLAAASRE